MEGPLATLHELRGSDHEFRAADLQCSLWGRHFCMPNSTQTLASDVRSARDERERRKTRFTEHCTSFEAHTRAYDNDQQIHFGRISLSFQHLLHADSILHIA